MPPVRRTAVAPPAQGVSFGDLGFYSGGFGIPEGDYALEFATLMYQPTRKDGSAAGNPFLAVNITAHPLNGGDPIEEAVSMGRGMTAAFVPLPSGKGLAAIPGTSAQGSGNTNWWFFLKSLYDSGLPAGVFDNDFSVLDGIHVHIQRQAEPEDRKQFRAATGEAGEHQENRTRTMPIVTEIKEDGKPWEGTGGIPEAHAPKVAAKPAAKASGPKAVVKPVAKPVAKVAPVQTAEEFTEEDVQEAALKGASSVLEAKPNGCPKATLRIQTFTAVQSEYGDDMAQAVTDAYFGSDDTINALVSQLGYTVKGMQIVVA